MCNKFCRIEECERCDFLDHLKPNDKVGVFISIYTPKEITKYKPFNIDGYQYGDHRWEFVNIIKFVDDYHVMVRHDKMKKNIKIDVDQISNY